MDTSDYIRNLPYRANAWNATLEQLGFLQSCRYLLHDCDTKFCDTFRETVKAASPLFVFREPVSQFINAICRRGMLALLAAP